MIQIKPPGIKLTVHLENKQNLVYESHIKESEEFLKCHINTPLTGYFNINEMESKFQVNQIHKI